MKMSVIFLLGLFVMNIQADMQSHDKIYIAGHRGLVGSAIVRSLQQRGYNNLIMRTHHELDLRSQDAVDNFFATEKPDYVFLCAAKVGGIWANWTYPAEFSYENLIIQCNVVHAAHTYGVKKLLFLGSSCIYPRDCPQPIKEEYLLSSPLEETNKSYAVAKIAGINMCQSYNKQFPDGTKFICCMPTNLYGPCDNYHPENSHVFPALIRKIYTAKQNGEKEVVIWGTGTPMREFLYVDDLADASIFLMQNYDGTEIVNIGTGKDITISDLAQLMKDVIGYEGEFVYNIEKPDGTPRKLLNVDRLRDLGWQAPTSLRTGIEKTVTWCQEHTIFE